MNRIISFVLVLFFTLTVFSIPAKRGVFSVLQSDGSEIFIEKHGDEFFHYTTTDDGYLVKKNQNGFYEYAELKGQKVSSLGVKAHSKENRTDAEFRLIANFQKGIGESQIAQLRTRSAKMQEIARSPKRVGSLNLAPRGLVILASYSDTPFTYNQADLDSLLCGINTTTNSPQGSAQKYFRNQSNNAYQPVFDVVGPVTLPKTLAYYGENNANGDDLYCGDLIIHACSIANANFSVDFSIYDNDNDGEVDFVYVIYAGYGEAATGAPENTIWPHSWSVQDAVNQGFAKEAVPVYDGKKINNYACSSELTGSSGTGLEGIGTFCHEFSHVLGLPDYYDTSSGSNSNKTLGSWNLMDYGTYNNDGKTPPNYSAYDKYFLGWATPVIMNEAENVTLNDISTNQSRVVTAAGTLPTATYTDWAWYFENRQKTGWDEYLPGHGLLVTKVKYNASAWLANTVNNGSTMFVDIVEADGSVSSTGDGGDTYPGTKNKTSYTPTGSYALTEIAENSGAVTFKFMGGVIHCDNLRVTYNLNKCVWNSSNEVCIVSGTNYTATITPETNYILTQSDISVKMGGSDLVVGTGFTYSGNTLSVPNVTGALEITAVANRDPETVTCSNYAYTFTSKASTGSLLLGNYSWSCSVTNPVYFGYNSTKGAQFGSSTNPAELVSLKTSETDVCCVSKITVSASVASGGDAVLSVYLDGVQVGTTQTLTTTNSNYEFTLLNPTKGELEIRMTNTKSAMYIKSITVDNGTCGASKLISTEISEVLVLSGKNSFTLKQLKTGSDIYVFDTVGKLLRYKQNVADDQSFYLPQGVYLVKVISDKKVTALKVVCN